MVDRYTQAFEFCLKEMFLRVGEKYPNKDLTDKTDWYMLRSWTMEDEENFRQWMVSYLRNKLRLSKKRAEREAAYFDMNFSWTNKFQLYMRVFYNG